MKRPIRLKSDALRGTPLAVLCVLIPLGTASPTTWSFELEDGVLSAGGFGRLSMLLGDISPDRDRPGDVRLHIPSIPVAGNSDLRSHGFNAHVKDSRLWFRAKGGETRFGRIEALVEGDMAGAADRYKPRMRHAYVSVGRLLVGQTWTNFTNTSSFAETDAGFAPGNIVDRRRQIRWDQPLSSATSLTVSLEEPVNRLHDADSGRSFRRSGDRNPDLVMRLGTRGNWGNVSVSLAAREIKEPSPTADGSAPDSETATAFHVGGRLATGIADNLRFSFSYGDGLSRYLTTGFIDATLTPEGELDVSTSQAGLIAWQHFWSTTLRSTFAASYARLDAHASASDALTRKARTGQTNLIWSPNSRYSVGVEYLFGWRETIGGDDGDINRLQLTARINF